MKQLSLLSLIAALLLAACGGGGGGGAAPAAGQAPRVDAFIAAVDAVVKAAPEQSEPADVDARAATAPEDSEAPSL